MGAGQQHRRKMGVGTGRELESQEFAAFGHGSGDLVVDRAVAGQNPIGDSPPQVGQVVEWIGHHGNATGPSDRYPGLPQITPGGWHSVTARATSIR